MNLLLGRLVRVLMRQGWKRGIQGGNPAWTAVGGLAVIGYLAGRALKREEEVVFREEMRPGDVFRVTHEATPPGKQARV